MGGVPVSFDWGTAVTAAVAVYGAGLSTYTFITQRRDNRPRVKVTLSYGALFLRDRPQIALMIGVSNPGKHNVTVKSVWLQLPNKHRFFMPRLEGTTQLPCELAVGQGQTFWMWPTIVAGELSKQGMTGDVKLSAGATDANGNEYRSEVGKFSVEQVLSEAKQA